MLPSKKRQTKIKKTNIQVKKLLSKTQRKKLEKIVEKKKKKENVSFIDFFFLANLVFGKVIASTLYCVSF